MNLGLMAQGLDQLGFGNDIVGYQERAYTNAHFSLFFERVFQV
jgi:hypothetical protein